MSRRPVMFLSALALAIGLTGCGGDGEGDAAEPTTANETTATQEVPTTPEPEPTDPDESTGAAEDGAEDSAGEPTLADAPDPGPAPEGAVLPSGALEDPPETIAGLTLDDSSRVPGHWYRDEERSTTVSVNPDNYVRPLEDYAMGLGDDAAPGGTGICGTNESGTSIICYQQTADGLSRVSGDPEEVTVDDMVVFVNQLADALGAA